MNSFIPITLLLSAGWNKKWIFFWIKEKAIKKCSKIRREKKKKNGSGEGNKKKKDAGIVESASDIRNSCNCTNRKWMEWIIGPFDTRDISCKWQWLIVTAYCWLYCTLHKFWCTWIHQSNSQSRIESSQGQSWYTKIFIFITLSIYTAQC